MAHQDRSQGSPDDEEGERFDLRQELTKVRSAIRREVIEWWAYNHAEGVEPETSREVLGLWLEEQSEKIRELPEKRVKSLAEKAEMHGRQVWLLDGIEPEDIPIVEDAVRSAHWTDNARASWSTVFEDFMDEHPSIFGALSFLVLIVSMWVIMLLVVRKDDFSKFPDRGAIVIGILAITLFVIHGRILVILGFVNLRLPNVWRWIAAGSALYFVVQDGWRSHIVDLVSKHKNYVPGFFRSAIGSVDICVLYALKGFATLTLVGIFLSFLDDVRYKVGPKEPGDAVTSARILLDLMELAKLSQEALRRESFNEGLRTYLTSSVRVEIIRHLEKVAQTAEGRWKRSLRVGDEIPDGAISEICDGIAAAARKWKVVAATGGEKLADMNQAFVAALIDAAKGNWELLAVETSEKELLRRKLFRISRHLLALAVMAGTSYIVLFDPFSWFRASVSPTVSSFVLMFAAIASVSIDPTIMERLGNASRITGAFGGKK